MKFDDGISALRTVKKKKRSLKFEEESKRWLGKPGPWKVERLSFIEGFVVAIGNREECSSL